ncbi:hypothetical protein QJS10_CPA08g00071 [Acorus calamus]|uniref:Uncharacterized protein n=1 Tax=Acorus calamus TaxID=4465 RepID=A0AAV9E9W3_ACOCL|nr:hypothetical protein QJS10_CPA08g00071 [Acorus calamus]
MLKKKDEEIANANTTVMTLKNHVFKLKTENFLWKKVAKDTGADVRTLNGELERVKQEFAAAGDIGVACMLKKKYEEIANANTTVTTLKNHVFKLKTENFLWKKVAKDTGADVRTLNGELERVKREFVAAGDTGSECFGSGDAHPMQDM